ncbi:hypothetical protein [Priestia taiwanensis]|uniref:Prephenate dehydratase n=1 Tax=Priestia taiwanensis TaxID=1347902 RepID=A0A917AN43_9BACI|nr:hypothetical protein [Priestia taiwanensis]MBM7362106.1 hypothetical protein [Priestia taiwanensis]GGE59525.1 hypothetical protein GCM10007140_07300 [Priestia taiwanensis]
MFVKGLSVPQNKQDHAITIIHTLGPKGTNCEKAGRLWLECQGVQGEVFLHGTLEEALIHVKKTEGSALLGCAVYPDLHHIVFKNLTDLELIDSFIMPTYNMVLASREPIELNHDTSIASHPAPVNLAHAISDNISLVNSNSQAAVDCLEGKVDACVTTIKAANEKGLIVIKDFGEVPMCFTIHGRKG